MRTANRTDLREKLLALAFEAGITSTALTEALQESQHGVTPEVLLDETVLHDEGYATLTYFALPTSPEHKPSSVIGVMRLAENGGDWFVYASRECDDAENDELCLTVRRITPPQRNADPAEEFSLLLLLSQVL